MLQITGDPKFADLVEETFYNSVLAGISLDGVSFFYTNTLRQLNPMPVDLRWERRREKCPLCFCCPPNVVRTIAQSANYAYLKSDRNIYAVMYGSNTLETKLGGTPLKLRQETNYPWDSKIKFTVETAPADEFTLSCAFPHGRPARTSRSREASLPNRSNRRDFIPSPASGGSGTRLSLIFRCRCGSSSLIRMSRKRRNQVAVVRGPIVYCLESIDLPEGTRSSRCSSRPGCRFETRDRPSAPRHHRS